MPALLGLMFLLNSVTSHALSEAECPDELTISYVSLIPVPKARIESLRDSAGPEVFEQARAAQQAIVDLPPSKLEDLSFNFSNDDGGICRYRRAGRGFGKLEIFNDAGSLKLRVWLPIRDFELYTDHAIARLRSKVLRIDYRPTTDLNLKLGPNAYQIGWAYSLTVE